MGDGSFFTLKIFGVTEAQEDLLISDLFEMGCTGVYEDLALPSQSSLYGESWNENIVETYPKIIKAHFQEAKPEIVEELSLRYANLSLELTQEANQDWNAEWKKSFKSFEFVPGVWIQPSWEESALDGKVIKMDPGMAFGTGTHATTHLAAQLIQKHYKPSKHKSFLEVGTGTGILGFLAHLMGGLNISVTENDPEAIRVVNENAAINNIRFNEVILAELPSDVLVDRKFDFVVANIIQTVLEKLYPDFLRLCTQGQPLILSGILDSDYDEFIEPWKKEFELIEKTTQDEWVGIYLKKK